MKPALGVADRRRIARGADHAPRRETLVCRILGMYAESPGLALGMDDAPGLLGLPPRTCGVVLRDLVNVGLLRLDAQERFVV